jgi:hypothetical protein
MWMYEMLLGTAVAFGDRPLPFLLSFYRPTTHKFHHNAGLLISLPWCDHSTSVCTLKSLPRFHRPVLVTDIRVIVCVEMGR